MARYAVLLRGINVGGRAKIPMADLRAALTQLGYTEVRTLLQSGNAVVDAPRATAAQVAKRVEAMIAQRFELPVRCLVRTAADLRAVLDGNPFDGIANNDSWLIALFLSDPLDPDLLAAHDPVALAPDQVRVGAGVIYQWCPDGVSNAPLVGPFVEKHLKVAASGRNWNTVRKLLELLEA